VEGLLKRMNIEHRTSNIECRMGKAEEAEFKKPELLEETEELISFHP
jgi:hypothetical protein